ncbi:hypothetical protein [Lachnoclostridium sp. Marseille-P6806]|uniref:hypothetical protein n=1 Tax=Lachnoclostridium sp. Marseille-P6806 TaxID=2364793 RepID=UPI003FA5DAC6
MYSNEVELEGIVQTSSMFHWQGFPARRRRSCEETISRENRNSVPRMTGRIAGSVRHGCGSRSTRIKRSMRISRSTRRGRVPCAGLSAQHHEDWECRT